MAVDHEIAEICGILGRVLGAALPDSVVWVLALTRSDFATYVSNGSKETIVQAMRELASKVEVTIPTLAGQPYDDSEAKPPVRFTTEKVDPPWGTRGVDNEGFEFIKVKADGENVGVMRMRPEVARLFVSLMYHEQATQ